MGFLDNSYLIQITGLRWWGKGSNSERFSIFGHFTNKVNKYNKNFAEDSSVASLQLPIEHYTFENASPLDPIYTSH